jgi:hypothetical protein
MNRAVRVLLIWIMVIAMPVQGWAASALRCAGMGHEALASGVASQPAHGNHHHHHDHAAPADAHEAPDGAGAHHGKGGCSACAACCSLLALPYAAPLQQGLLPAQVMQGVPLEQPSSQPPQRLERPPRSHLA